MKKATEFLKIIRENRRLKEETENLRQEAEYYKELVGLKRRLVGRSQALRRCLAEAEAVARVPRPVLITGERGTGKELVASYIHQRSERSSGPFITVNCAALSGNLLESEMFGHEKGAFTGAAGRKPGRFELADGGTLFLDEIATMSADFQEMILRVVEYQRFERVQGTETVEVDVRILAATNADMEAEMAAGRFRRDLYDRLAFKVVRVPPLRERPEDVETLVEYFLSELQREVPSIGRKRVSAGGMERLRAYGWPGNVRQLRNVVERLAIETQGDRIDVDGFGADDRPAPAATGTLTEKVDEFERALVEGALSAAGGNQRAAARALGVTYDQFRHYYRKYGLKSLS
jgi:DNA-binding NtrC family response regulator